MLGFNDVGFRYVYAWVHVRHDICYDRESIHKVMKICLIVCLLLITVPSNNKIYILHEFIGNMYCMM